MAKVKKPKDTVSIKFYEVVNWLFSPATELPEKFKMNPIKLNGIVPYLTEQFWTMPDLTSYLNKHVNDLYKIPDPLENLKLLKKIIQERQISRTQVWNFMPNRQPNLLKELQERDNLDTGDALSKRMLMKRLNIDTSYYFKVAPTKANTDLNNNVSKVIVKEAIVRTKAKEIRIKEDARASDTRFLTKLNQEVIDDLQLILFDVSLLKKTNRVLFTFIDSGNLKRYFMAPFMAEIYLSKKDGVINNDYIETLNEEDYIKYVIKDVKLYNKLKFMLNNSYKKILNSTSVPGEELGKPGKD